MSSYLKFTKTFLDTIVEPTDAKVTDIPKTKEVVNSALKNALYGNYSFYTVESELKEAVEFIQLSFLLKNRNVGLEALSLSTDKLDTHTREVTQTWGDIKQDGSYFEPIESGSQDEVKTNSNLTTNGNDTITETETNTAKKENEALLEYLKDISIKAEQEFKTIFVNTLFALEEDEVVI